MRARRLVSVAPYQMDVEEYELSDTPPAGQVLVQARVTAVSAGTEVANYRGITKNRPADSTKPYYPGYSFAGKVLAVGDRVSGFQVGDRVCGMVNHLSHGLADPSRIAPIPDGVTDEQAAMSTLGIIVLNAVRKPSIQLGESVAVVGAGLIGQLASQLARLAGGRPVVSLDFLAARRELAAKNGADAALDPNEPGTQAALERLAPGGFNVVFEATGSNLAVNPAIKLAARGGRVVLLGSTRGLVDQFDPYGDVHLKGLTIIGAHITTHMEAPNLANPWTPLANRRVILDLIRRGELNVDSLISHRVAPSEAGKIYAGLAENPSGYFGVIFDWSRL
ncbi:MAG TPA: zinc-binding alcohol dehydrogenase [Chloroflexota bacterium]|nr:zinc-binding alcohol dehydrogenase [Chloroflexota bacterium]